jgi:hypothetical protein
VLVYILAILFVEVQSFLTSSPCDPSMQGGKIGKKKELCLPWLRIVVYTSDKCIGSADYYLFLWLVVLGGLNPTIRATPQITCYK